MISPFAINPDNLTNLQLVKRGVYGYTPEDMANQGGNQNALVFDVNLDKTIQVSNYCTYHLDTVSSR